jgi:hypothetical protein
MTAIMSSLKKADGWFGWCTEKLKSATGFTGAAGSQKEID